MKVEVAITDVLVAAVGVAHVVVDVGVVGSIAHQVTASTIKT